MTATIITTTELQAALFGSATPTAANLRLINLAHAMAEGNVRQFLHYDPVQMSRTEYYPNRDDEHYRGHDPLGFSHWDINDTHAFAIDHHHHEQHKIILEHIPVRSISEIREDREAKAGFASGAFAASTLLTQGDDYWLDFEGTSRDAALSGIVYRNRGWSNEPRSIRVIYTAGYTANEFQGRGELDASPIKYATLLTAEWIYSQLRSRQSQVGQTLADCAGVESERLGDYSYKINSKVAEKLGCLIGPAIPDTACVALEPFEHMGRQVI